MAECYNAPRAENLTISPSPDMRKGPVSRVGNAQLVLVLAGSTEEEPTVIRLARDLPATGPKVLDHAEKILLTLFHNLMRDGFSGFGTRPLRHRVDAAQADQGGRVVECSQAFPSRWRNYSSPFRHV